MRALPLRHLSIRVPWHDNGWNGTICKKPLENVACICLGAIHEHRNDKWENDNKTQPVKADAKARKPPCISERAAFMCSRKLDDELFHKLRHDSLYAHFKKEPTPFEMPAYSAPAVPFRWLMRKEAAPLSDGWKFDYDADKEPLDDWKKNSTWVLHPDNQKACLQAFWSAIRPEQSLVFFYAKHVPFAETDERILVGIGRVKSPLGPLREYRKGDPEGFGAWVWERSVMHSIRPDMQDGFILPYQALLPLFEKDSTLDLMPFLALAPNDTRARRAEFSYVAEHVSAEGAIRALQACHGAISQLRQIAPGSWDLVNGWINDRLTEVKKLRGMRPGLGAALSAFGMPLGIFVADELVRDLPDSVDPWVRVEQIFADPSKLPRNLQHQISPMLRDKWNMLRNKRPKRIEWLRALSCLEISAEQAKLLYDEDLRSEASISESDEAFLSNPYLVFHDTRLTHDPISFFTPDVAMFWKGPIHPLTETSRPNGPDDHRRISALATHVLESAQEEGHSVLPRNLVLERIRELTLDPPCPIDRDALEVLEECSDAFESLIPTRDSEDGERFYQLPERDDFCALIRGLKRRILKANRYRVPVDWAKGYEKATSDEESRSKQKHMSRAVLELARTERISALRELAESPVSVLVGAAGTGKTKLLEILCGEERIRTDGILLLAPTGKARVQLQKSAERRLRSGRSLPAFTLAQFLLDKGRFDPDLMRYRRNKSMPPTPGWKTVIIDEASMLTEDMLAAVMDAVSGYERLILVGDPAQLPPIGVGKPFIDLVNLLQEQGKGHALLTVRFRQEVISKGKEAETPSDLLLADWFSGRGAEPAADEVFSDLSKRGDLGRVCFVPWKDHHELQKLIPKVLANELKKYMTSVDDADGFALSIGGVQDEKGFTYFNRENAAAVENWQILSPIRHLPGGTVEINRQLQHRFRAGILSYANGMQKRTWRIPRPVGPEEIVYGDKVINSINRRTGKGVYVWPEEGAANYIANGEIGFVVGKVERNPEKRGLPRIVQAAFASQPNFMYSFTRRFFGDDRDNQLELAYAITVHKAQGSQFKLVLLIIPERCPTLSRELLYTALTRQEKRIVLLLQGDIHSMNAYASAQFSETARRFTFLFEAPKPREITIVPAHGAQPTGRPPARQWYDDRFIHRTGSGLAVESKSELVIATELELAKIPFIYGDRVKKFNETRYPDFTIRDPDTQQVYYWEHCGVHTSSYKRRWARKLKWYARQGITEWDGKQNPNGRLVVTRDSLQGGLDAQTVRQIIHQLFKD
jgi:hypothetical protein